MTDALLCTWEREAKRRRGRRREREEDDQTENGQIEKCCLGVNISYSCTTVPTCTDVL